MSDDEKWVRISRMFDAPIDRVWKMWTDPDLFRQWYGPNGASIPVAEMDLIVGGQRKICMEVEARGQTMTMWFTGVYKEIDAPRRLVYTESMCDETGTLISPASMGMPGQPDVTEVIVDLTENDGKTCMTMVHAGVPEGSAATSGWMQAFDKLEALFERV